MKFAEELEKGVYSAALFLAVRPVLVCSSGPIVIVYPDAVWYQGVKPENVNEILEQHILNGKPVERLVIPDSAWG